MPLFSRGSLQITEALPGVWWNRGEMKFISGEEGNKGQVLRETKTIVGNREHKKSTKEGKDQDSIQSSTTPDPGYQWESNKLTIGQRFSRNRGTSLFISRKQSNRYPSFYLFLKLMLYVHGKHVAKVMLGQLLLKPLRSRASLTEFIKIIIEGLGSVTIC